VNEWRSDAAGPIISVIIPTKDRPQACRDTVTALRDQALPASEYEIVVVDDGSRPLPESSWLQDRAQCTLVRLGGRERSAARNFGAQVAGADLLVFLDDDVTVDSGFLEAHLAAHREWEGALVVGAIRLHKAALRRPFARFRQALERQGIPDVRFARENLHRREHVGGRGRFSNGGSAVSGGG
jgi:glycosyltransferase involved in cell wall biosynthesis